MPEASKESEIQKVGFTETIKLIFWSFRIMAGEFPIHTVIYFLTSILLRFQGLAYSLLFAYAIDKLIEVIQNPGVVVEDLYNYILILFIYGAVSSLLWSIKSYSDNYISTKLSLTLRRKFYFKLAELGISTVEQPDINNRIDRARSELFSLIRFTDNAVSITGDLARLVTTFSLILGFSPLIGALIVIASIPSFFLDRIMRTKHYRFRFENTEGIRIANSNAYDVSDPHTLHEIITTKALNFLDKKFHNYMSWYDNYNLKLDNKYTIGDYLFELLRRVVISLGYIETFRKFLSKSLSIGKVTFWMNTINSFDTSLSQISYNFNSLTEHGFRLREVYLFFNSKTMFPDGNKDIGVLEKGPEISIKNINFVYPGAEKKVISNLSLEVKSGEKLAIVGKNGAGKTTLIKLVCRFYPVTKGEVLINGINVNEITSNSLYQNIGTLFQDFNLYEQLSVKDNICIGRPDELPDEIAMRIAAQTADAMDFISEYKTGFDTLLSERYKGGIRPSTGQWQKIALARFFYRSAPLVIFDEPTAAIDAASEAKIFTKIYEFFENKTVIIISHRFSTVRNADRIIVLDDGQIVEQGTHESLLKLNGKYAEGFRLQAEGYKE